MLEREEIDRCRRQEREPEILELSVVELGVEGLREGVPRLEYPKEAGEEGRLGRA